MFVVAFNSEGATVWNRPLQLGSAGSDRIQAVSVDLASLDTTGEIYLYVCGRVGGRLFRPPRMTPAPDVS
jgi:outer membrane protein assembly factor BamB